ncbi:MAG: hypothetical protein L0170_17900 [Acidobacteria bacterium]|nr:hypothetical protein [Acidobacteriota bacterium]
MIRISRGDRNVPGSEARVKGLPLPTTASSGPSARAAWAYLAQDQKLDRNVALKIDKDQ